MTNIVSTLRTVCNRCAMIIVVIPSLLRSNSFKASWTAASDSCCRSLHDGCKLGTPVKDSEIRNEPMTYLDPMLTVMGMKPLVPSGGKETI